MNDVLWQGSQGDPNAHMQALAYIWYRLLGQYSIATITPVSIINIYMYAIYVCSYLCHNLDCITQFEHPNNENTSDL